MANGSPVPRIETIHPEFVKATDRLRERHAVTPREVEPAETSVSKYSVSGNQEFLLLEVQADASWCMSRGMEDLQGSDAVSFGKKLLRRDTGGSCAEMKGEAHMILGKSRGIEAVDCNNRVTHMRYLLDVCGVIIVAVCEHDGIDLPPVGFDRSGKDTGVNKNIADEVGIRYEPSSRDPRDWHA